MPLGRLFVIDVAFISSNTNRGKMSIFHERPHDFPGIGVEHIFQVIAECVSVGIVVFPLAQVSEKGVFPPIGQVSSYWKTCNEY